MDCELAPVLHVAPRTAQRTYETARTVCAVLPATWAAMRAGDLEPARAEAIAGEVPRLRPEVCAQVEAALFPAVADPDEVGQRAARARADRFVLVRPGLDPGMSEWVAAQPAESSAAAWAAVDELAHAYVADGEHRSLEQARADAMIDLILGQATITTTLELSLPLSALPGPDDGTRGDAADHDPAAVRAGLGGGPGWVRRTLRAAATAAGPARRRGGGCEHRTAEPLKRLNVCS